MVLNNKNYDDAFKLIGNQLIDLILDRFRFVSNLSIDSTDNESSIDENFNQTFYA